VRIEWPILWIILLNAGGWVAIQMSLAWAFTRMPASWFNPPVAFTCERTGRFYESFFAIKRWKDRLPDAARWFSGGFPKATLSQKNPDYLHRFIRETWRGELCHWVAILCAPVFFLWNPWWSDWIIVAYALAANLPCILVQRYNRVRLGRLLARQHHQWCAEKRER
jgi:glycosyl-4,4'-diaponeurosporenoate acyltransferase